MNTNMLEHPAVVENLATLAARGVRFVEPGSGYLACGWIGKGRLAEPEDIVAAVDAALAPKTTLAGRTILVTAGPTYEDLDPVRYVGNRSSGRMGMAIAEEAARRGARVRLVLGPTSIAPPPGIEVERVRSAADMHAVVMREAGNADVVVMSAAVADYTPSGGAEPQKVAKADGPLTLTLVRTKDILGDLGRARNGSDKPLLVGFAAETQDVLTRARAKLRSKLVDLIVANDVSRADAGFEVETNVATLVDAAGETPLPLMSKRDLAGRILDRVEARLGAE
jgi:phosphopantothenoylcysteine decarboxylase/phosphopantothenate--cysteine ligase